MTLSKLVKIVFVIFAVMSLESTQAGRHNRREEDRRGYNQSKKHKMSRRAMRDAKEERIAATVSGPSEDQEMAVEEPQEGEEGAAGEEGKGEMTIEEYIAKIEDPVLREVIQRAEYLMKTMAYKEAFDIYQQVAITNQEPLAYFRLGELFEKEENLGQAYIHYKLAFDKGFNVIETLSKTVELGLVLAEHAAGTDKMSEEVRARMYS